MAPNATIRALTMHRPWAPAFFLPEGRKDIENRFWPPPAWLVGGYLAIHSGQTYDDSGAEFIAQRLGRALVECEPSLIYGVVRVTGVVQDSASRWFFGPTRDGKPNFGWTVDEAVGFEKPVFCKGAQGLWWLPDDVLPIVRERWVEAKRKAKEVKT